MGGTGVAVGGTAALAVVGDGGGTVAVGGTGVEVWVGGAVVWVGGTGVAVAVAGVPEVAPGVAVDGSVVPPGGTVVPVAVPVATVGLPVTTTVPVGVPGVWVPKVGPTVGVPVVPGSEGTVPVTAGVWVSVGVLDGHLVAVLVGQRTGVLVGYTRVGRGVLVGGRVGVGDGGGK